MVKVRTEIERLKALYELDIEEWFEPNNWDAILSNLTELCAAISEMNSGGEITETSVSIPFKVTLDGVTTNYEFTTDSDGNPIIMEVG